jgi:hypothetical protein
MNSYDFKQCYEVSKIAISIVTRWLMEQKTIISVINVEDDERFQELDVDLLAIVDDSTCKLIEVKADRYDTGNFFLELISDVEKDSRGCMLQTKSDYVFYYFTKMHKLYSLSIHYLQKWLIDNRAHYHKKTVETSLKNGRSYHTVGICVPIQNLVKLGHAKELKLDEQGLDNE